MQMRRDFTQPKMRGWVFVFTGAEHTLVKSAYTGVAAALIGGKTTHSIAGISSCFNSQSKMSRATKAKLQSFWKSKTYLIIDTYLMLSKTFLAAISNNISIGKQGSETSFPDWTFGGINVVLCGDLHQFPPVAKNRQEFLFTPVKSTDSKQCQLGRTYYELFKTVVVLKEQKRVIDPVWHQTLTNVRNGRMQKEDVETLRKLIVGGPLHDTFDVEPWSNACLVTPRHAVRIVWNKLCARRWCRKSRQQLFICLAQDTVEDCPLTLTQHISVATFSPEKKNRGTLLADEVELAKGLKVMVTNNLATDLDITNGA
jgi:hypothetical protein